MKTRRPFPAEASSKIKIVQYTESRDKLTGHSTEMDSFCLITMPFICLLFFFQKTVHVTGSADTGRYYVIVHFYQPNFLSFLGKVVVSGQNAASTLLTFRYCPHVSGCRAVGTSQHREGMSESIYIGRQKNILVSIAIPEDKGVWIVSV